MNCEHNRRLETLLILFICVLGTMGQPRLLDKGISWELAQHRKTTISRLHYHLQFAIPEDKNEAIEAKEAIYFELTAPTDIILDFNEEGEKIHKVMCAEKASRNEMGSKREPCKWKFINGHIVIPQEYTQTGRNCIEIEFTAGNQGLNRRDGYVYTLFVPDRAHTVFPCFDQPNMKATFDLELEVPQSWTAVSNGFEKKISDVKKRQGTRDKAKKGCKHMSFGIDTPIPTYLFAFAAGEFSYQTYEEGGMKIGTYHRETDTARIAQLPEIMHQVVFSMRWQEEFTTMKYPFPKYDLVILPGFQFGGMEHVGATFYNDNTIFLPANPTPDERLRRTELIAHETSHMWFGDAVTMNWFDDVWTKEVFANYFAAEITAPLFPDLNHELNWLKTYTAAAISQDRTEGRTSIRQPLDNMRFAGLIYNNIIYNKAPVMMRKMVDIMGKENFKRGIQKYVQKYRYDNATWDDLIAILDAETDADLKSFSREWVDEAHWWHYKANSIDDPRIGKEYGYFELSPEQCKQLITTWQDEKDGARRQALLMTLNENYLNKKINDEEWQTALIECLKKETDPLTSLTLVGYMSEPLRATFQQGRHFDIDILALSSTHPLPAVRTQLLRLLISGARTPEVIEKLYQLWKENAHPLLSENDFITLSYELAIRMPEKADSILKEQRARLSNPDRIAQFDFISRAANPSQEGCDALFESLKQAENRRIEPWTLSALYYLNHPLREAQSIKYIRPALELLPEIQRTGDIFFPGNWCSNLLAGHRSIQAYDEVSTFLSDHPEMMQLMRNKVLQAMYYLKRAATK